jgi:Homeodomain-like domain
MPGPLSAFCPVFPDEFLAQARATLRRKTAPQQAVPRCRLVLLLQENPHLPQPEAGRCVGLSGRQVLRWRQRWAAGDFSLADAPGRGRKALFSPPGPGGGQGRRL